MHWGIHYRIAAEIIFMNGDIINLVIPVIIVVMGDVLLLITIIEYICIAECV